MTLTAWGDILRKPDVVFIGQLPTVPLDPSCRGVLPIGPGSKKAPSKKTLKAARTEAGSYGGYDGVQLYQGQGDINTGFFTVYSPHHKVNVKKGHFQLTYFTGYLNDDFASEPIDKMPSDANWVAVSSDIKLSFYKADYY